MSCSNPVHTFSQRWFTAANPSVIKLQPLPLGISPLLVFFPPKHVQMCEHWCSCLCSACVYLWVWMHNMMFLSSCFMSIFKVLSSHSKEKVLLVSSSVLATKADAETRRLFKTVELMYFLSVCVDFLPQYFVFVVVHKIQMKICTWGSFSQLRGRMTNDSIPSLEAVFAHSAKSQLVI